MFATLAYHSSAAGVNAALAQLNALADPMVQPQNNNVVVPGQIGAMPPLNKLVGYLAVGATLTGAQLQSPSLRQLFFPDIRPIDVGAEPTSPSKYIDLYGDPITLAVGEQLEALITNTASDEESLLIWLDDGQTPTLNGEIQTVKATATTTLTADAWSNCTITMSQTLPAGQYAVVGMRYEGATGIAARILFPGQYWRPGVPASVAKSGLDHRRFRNGNLGVFGQFSTTVLPSVDCLAAAADTAETFWLDLIKVSSTP